MVAVLGVIILCGDIRINVHIRVVPNERYKQTKGFGI